jgi:membrane-associated phospholipid phosphatase
MTVQRLRFRALLFLDDSLDNPADYFSNWFNANNKLPFLPNDMVQSFPSGHVLIATNLISIWLFIKKTYKKNNLILWTKIAIIAVLALNVIGRIISGAHYMSDVGWSLLLGTIVTVSVMYIYSLRINRMQVKTHKSHKLLD